MFQTLKSWLTATRDDNSTTGETKTAHPRRTDPDNSPERRASPATFPRRRFLTACGALAGGLLVADRAAAQLPTRMTVSEGQLSLNTKGVSPFTLRGKSSFLGQYVAIGEVKFVPDRRTGGLDGRGVVAFRAANGDVLVGVLSWDVDAKGVGGRIYNVQWRDSVTFSDGTVVDGTGWFEQNRPQAVVTIEYLILGTFLALALIVGVSS